MPKINSKFNPDQIGVKIQKSKIPQAKKIQKVSKGVSSKGLSVEVFDVTGKSIGLVELPKEIFGAPINNVIMAQAIRVYLANQRQGTKSTKTRGEVRGSTRKIYKQKGTGRARHGAIRAPIFVHGGVAHGPKSQDYSLLMPKKMKKAALFSALSSKARNNEIKIVKNLDKIEQKTKEMTKVLKNLNLDGKNNRVLLVLPSDLTNVQKASRNIEGVNTTVAQRLNTYEVLDNKMLLMMDLAVEEIKKHFLK